MIRVLSALLVVLAFGVAATAQTKPDARPPEQGDPVTEFAPGDVVMNAAIAEANATLPLFLTYGFTDPTAMLKVAMPMVTTNADEIIWVEGLSRTATGFAGYLANAPVDLGALRRGDYVEFEASQINDWGLRSADGRLYGHYTTRVIADLPGNASMWQSLMPDPVPNTWR